MIYFYVLITNFCALKRGVRGKPSLGLSWISSCSHKVNLTLVDFARVWVSDLFFSSFDHILVLLFPEHSLPESSYVVTYFNNFQQTRCHPDANHICSLPGILIAIVTVQVSFYYGNIKSCIHNEAGSHPWSLCLSSKTNWSQIPPSFRSHSSYLLKVV